jgi:CTP synthase
VVEYARNVCKLEDAYSAEFRPEAQNPVIDIMEEQKNVDDYGGTMRLGAYQCELRDGSLAQRIYGQKSIYERHRHRYEFNNTYREKLEQDGLVVSGINPKKNLVEIVELPEHRWFLACQFHPEFRSRPMEPHPLFESFVGACLSGVKQRRNTGESDAC